MLLSGPCDLTVDAARPLILGASDPKMRYRCGSVRLGRGRAGQRTGGRCAAAGHGGGVFGGWGGWGGGHRRQVTSHAANIGGGEVPTAARSAASTPTTRPSAGVTANARGGDAPAAARSATPLPTETAKAWAAANAGGGHAPTAARAAAPPPTETRRRPANAGGRDWLPAVSKLSPL